jgi:hypothetical protein
MNQKPAFVSAFLVILVVISTACQTLPGTMTQAPPTPIVSPFLPAPSETIPNTQAVTPTQKSTPLDSPNPQPQTGSIRGRLGYPSEVVPDLIIVAFLYGTDTFYSIVTDLNQTEYQFSELPAGNYHLVAYTRGEDAFPEGLAGGYTQAVLCGMQEGCNDHSLVDVRVVEGKIVENADILDWLVPLPPKPQAGSSVMGAITGRLSYPSEMIPAMKVVAYQVGSGTFYSVNTHERDAFFVLPVPAGVYQVVAYTLGGGSFPTGLAGGYTQVVLCGFSESCVDHSLIEVSASQGSVTAGIDPGDFYAPEGTFPPIP